MTATAALSLLPRRATAQTTTLRWWAAQMAPAQQEAYRFQIAQFEALHPGVRVSLESTSDEGYPAQFAAAFSSGEVPDVVTHLPSFAAQTYYANGLIEPFDDVIAAVGAENFYPGANDPFRTMDGRHCAGGIGNASANFLWVRRDLMREAGIDKIPETWDELRAACQAMQTAGRYGAALPYGRTGMTSLIFVGFIHQAGGHVFTPDLELDLDNEGTRNALEFYKSMRELCPPGANSYSWGESLTAFVSGATATGIYTGRVLINVTEQNPAIAGDVTCQPYPRISLDVEPWTFSGFPSIFIPSQSQNIEIAKEFAAFLYEPEGYIRQMHAAPGHLLPVLSTISNDPRYQDNPIIEQYASEIELMSVHAARGKNLGWETEAHRVNEKGGEIIGAGPIADMVQRVVLNGENMDTVLSDTSRAIEQIMRS